MARRGALTVEVTVSSFSSYVAFLEGYARALVAAETSGTGRGPGCARRSGRRAPKCAYAPDASPLGSLTRVVSRACDPSATSSRLAQEVFALPARLADARRRKVVVALDEFQAIGGFNGGSVEHAHARRRPASARGRLRLRRLGAEPDGAHARPEAAVLQGRAGHAARKNSRGRVRRVHRRDGSAAPGIKPEDGLGAAIVELAGNLPYDVQRLAHETWDEVRAAGRRRATLDDLHAGAPTRLLAEQEMMFEAIWQRLTLPQRAVLRAVVLEDGRELLSADVRTRHRLGGRVDAFRRRWRRSCATMSSRATATVTSSWIRCCASGSRGTRFSRADLDRSHVRQSSFRTHDPSKDHKIQ